MAFKVKNKPIKKIVDNRITLHAQHNNKMIDLENKKEKICDINLQLTSLRKTSSLLEHNYKKNIDKILDIKDKIIYLIQVIYYLIIIIK